MGQVLHDNGSASNDGPPDWATWRSELLGFTFEPAAIAYNRRLFNEDDLPRSHRELASFVRDTEARLAGRMGGYD